MTDISQLDVIGAINTWEGYIKNELGYNRGILVEFSWKSEDRGSIYLTGSDDFQKGVDYTKKVGELSSLISFKQGSSWDEINKEVWESLISCMRRDERELRFGVQQLSGMIEGFTMQTAVGKMIHQRLLAVRDEMSGNLITYQQQKEKSDEIPY